MAMRTDGGGYSVANVRSHRGHEGMRGVNGTLLRDGKKVAEFYDDARGGEWELRFFDAGGRPVHGGPEAERLDAFVKALPPEPSDFGGEPLRISVDMFLAGLCDEYEATTGHEKWLRGRCATQTLFLHAGEKDGPQARYRVVKRPYSPEVKAHLLAKYPGCIIINERFPQDAGQRKLAESGVRVGDRVRWGEGAKAVTGRVERINPKTLTIHADDGRKWRCPLGGRFVKVGPLAPAGGERGAVGVVNERNGTEGARSSVVVTREGIEALEGAWVGVGEKVGLAAGTEIVHLALKDEGGDDMTCGPLVAVAQASGQRIPVVIDKAGKARWFLASEAKKVARLLAATLALE